MQGKGAEKEGDVAIAMLVGMGDSVGAVFPEEVRGNDFKLGDEISFKRVGPDIVISHVEKRPTLDSLMEGYESAKPGEIDFGESMGKEMW